MRYSRLAVTKVPQEQSSIDISKYPKILLMPRFLLGEKRSISSSWLQVLSVLENKDGTRTVEMILISTVLPPTVVRF